MKTRLFTSLVTCVAALSAATVASADQENKLVVNDGQTRVWKFVKTDASSTFISKEETEKLENIDFDKDERTIKVEPIEVLKEPSVVKTEEKPSLKYELAPNSRAYIGIPDRSEQEVREIEYKKYNYYRSATTPDGRYVEPLYTVAGAGVKTQL